MRAFTTLIAIAYANQTSCPGACIDTSTTKCWGALSRGLCPGAASIECCEGAVPSCNGVCINKDLQPCAGTLRPGECPGPAAIECCAGAPPPPPPPSGAYDPQKAVANARAHYNRVQHDCATPYLACSPWAYFGGEACGFPSHGGDCANFLSQNLLAGGHPALTQAPCRGYPCGHEEVGAANLGACLAKYYGWRSTCGAKEPPPRSLKVGDALIFHGKSCADAEAHATLVVHVGGGFVGLAAHSTDVFNKSVSWSRGSRDFEVYKSARSA